MMGMFGVGDRISQIIFEQIAIPAIEEAVDFPRANKGSQGFGSTGNMTSASVGMKKEKEEFIWREHSSAH